MATVAVLTGIARHEDLSPHADVVLPDIAALGAWIDARTAIYVHGSKRKGSMGPTFASFSKEEDAQKFIAEYGGTLVRMADIKPEMVDLRGGVNTDDRM